MEGIHVARVLVMSRNLMLLLLGGLLIFVVACAVDEQPPTPTVPVTGTPIATVEPTPFTVQFQPVFPTDLTDEEIAAIAGWNDWLFSTTQNVQRVVLEQIAAAVIDDSTLLFNAFAEQIGDSGILLVQRMEALNQNREELNSQGVVNTSDMTQLIQANASVAQSLTENIGPLPETIALLADQIATLEILINPASLPTTDHAQFCQQLSQEFDIFIPVTGNYVTALSKERHLRAFGCV